MWDDIVHLDKLLGGSGEFKMAGHKHTHGSEKYSVAYDSTLSESNTIYLCCLIYKEIQVYQDMILKSLNLDHSQKRESLTSLLTRCHADETSEDIDNNLDLMVEPYSWAGFRKSTTCTSLLS